MCISVLQDEVANGAAVNGADGHSALANRLDAVLHVPPQYQVLIRLAVHISAQTVTGICVNESRPRAL